MRRPFAAIGGMALTLIVLGGTEAVAGTYVVRQCHAPPAENRMHEGEPLAFGPYAVSAGLGACESQASQFALGTVPGADAAHGQYGRVRFTAPFGTELVRVETDALLRREQGHTAQLRVTDTAGGNATVFAFGGSDPTTFARYSWPAGSGFGAPRRRFEAGLFCVNPGGGCTVAGGGEKAKALIRNLQLTLRDVVPPKVSVSGSLLAEGWVRGAHELRVDASDLGGGVEAMGVLVNGRGTDLALNGCRSLPGTRHVSVLAPCQSEGDLRAQTETTAAPFHDGRNGVQVCATDYGTPGNRTCLTRAVLVDNTAPTLVLNDPDPSDPELLSATTGDATSGPESGSIQIRRQGGSWEPLRTSLSDDRLRARVNSDAYPPGLYAVRATVADRAGNQTSSTERADGSELNLRFPLRASVEIDAELGNGADDQTVPYRREGRVRGRVLDEAGEPVADQPLTVLERFERGSQIERRERVVRTGADGRFRSKLPGGPTRDVAVDFAGSRTHRAARAEGLDFNVRGSAQLRISKRRVRAGSSVRFHGRVKRYFARIPKGGKTVELQVRAGPSWTTLGEAVGTDRRGRIRLRHRFRGFYTQPVTFTFRLKARGESGWPYRGAAVSGKQRVTVVPKRRQ